MTNAASKKTNEVNVQDTTTTDKKVINENLDKLMKTYTSKANVIRYLSSKGHSRGDISRFMGIRYQHVRNVLITPLKKS